MNEITKEYLLEKLEEIISSNEVSIKDKLAAIKMAGEHLEMFGGKKNEINIKHFLMQLSTKQLENISDDRIVGKNPVYEIEAHTVDTSSPSDMDSSEPL
jgi:hypothetical protein